MKIVDSSYNDFPNEQVLSLDSYVDSSKRMSFSFRDGKDNQSIFAYASLKKEIIDGKAGCRILDFQNIDVLANERFFSRIELSAQIWIDNDNDNDAFSCLWFYTKDISEDKAKEMLNYIDGFEYNEGLKAYIKIFNDEEMQP